VVGQPAALERGGVDWHPKDMNRAAPKLDRKRSGLLGRPRRLSVEQILDAARELGPHDLTMSAVAKRLGVNVTVLYGYVSSRAELVRLLTSDVTRDQAVVTDQGQDWSIYVAQSAAALYTIFTGPGQLLQYFLTGGLGPEIEIDRTEAWLEKLTASGFTVEEALDAQRRMGEIVIGGAVTALHARALEQAGRSFAEGVEAAMAARAGAAPLLASAQGQFAERAPVWRQSVLDMLESLARRRGEDLALPALQAVLA
jgi:AcrR family transcriptional regulator